MKVIKIQENNEQELIENILTEVFIPNREKTLAVKSYLDKNFFRMESDDIDINGYPSKTKSVGLLSSDGKQCLKFMNMRELLLMLDDKFATMYSDRKDRLKFLKQVIKDWYNKQIDKNGLLSVNSL